MAQGTIRKGFFFYFGLFVLLLISIFMICLVVMMFNPGKPVLWMQYFTGNEHYYVAKTTDGNVIDYNSLTNIEIDCGYAQVAVQRNKQYNENGIHIFNNAKGFSAASNAVDFGYTTTLSGTTLKIELTEPNGFLYFSKDIQIVLNSNVETSFSYDNIKLSVNTIDGNVVLGNASYGAEEFNLAGLDVKTKGKGNILVGAQFNASNLTTLSLESEEGVISSLRDVTYETGKTAKGFYAKCDAKIVTNKGRVNLGIVNIPTHNLSITCKKGDIAIDIIKANDTNVSCVQGNYKFGKIYGNLDYTNSEDTIISPNIMADYISGNFRLTTDGDVDAEPDINFKEVQGNIVLFADKGRLIVKKAHGAIDVISANQLVVDIIVADDKLSESTISIDNEAGEVKLGFLGSVSGNVIVRTNTASLTFNVTSVAKFVADSFVNDNTETNRLADDKISVSHGLSGQQSKNPLTVDGTSAISGNIKVVTNRNVAFNLVSVETLVA
ncbi:MAG: hypothetical protein ACI4R8_04740 [Candidatus Caccovivens sp.]